MIHRWLLCLALEHFKLEAVVYQVILRIDDDCHDEWLGEESSVSALSSPNNNLPQWATFFFNIFLPTPFGTWFLWGLNLVMNLARSRASFGQCLRSGHGRERELQGASGPGNMCGTPLYSLTIPLIPWILILPYITIILLPHTILPYLYDLCSLIFAGANDCWWPYLVSCPGLPHWTKG